LVSQTRFPISPIQPLQGRGCQLGRWRETLERRLCLSVFYDFDIIARTGDDTSTGDNLDSFRQDVSVNDAGRVAFVGNLSGTNGTGTAVVVSNGAAAPLKISFPTSVSRDFSFPQINNDDQVVARDRISGTSFVRTWSANTPILSSTIAKSGDRPFPEVDFDSVTLPTRGDDGGVAFVGLVGATNGLYFNNGPALLADDQLITTLNGGGFRPMSGDNGTVVIRNGTGTTGDIVVFERGLFGFRPTTLASTSAGWISVGAAPGISSDGKIVVFVGDQGNGLGVFASMNDGSGFSAPIRIAGENPIVGPKQPELGFNDAGNPIFFSSFDTGFNRVGVTHQDLGRAGLQDDSFVVTFIATPSSASRNNPTPAAGGKPLLFSAQTGIWSVRVDIENQLQAPRALVVHPTSPIPVIQMGDRLNNAAVIGLSLYDPLGNATKDQAGNARTSRRGDHYLAFWASTSTGEVLVRGAHLDSDEDGLLDHWETRGIDIDQDGTIDLNLNAMGANPLHRDLFLEIDWLVDRISGVPTNWSNEPAAGVTQFLVDMFADAPALPSGVPGGTEIPPGIKVHIDAGRGNDTDGNPFSHNMPIPDELLQGGDEIGQPGIAAGNPQDHPDVVFFGPPNSPDFMVPGVQTQSFQQIKEGFFGTADRRARELAFHYAIFADFYDFIRDTTGKAFTAAVTASTSTTLTSAVALPPAGVRSDLRGQAVKIISGTGAGQVRSLAAGSRVGGNQLVVSQPWAVPPQSDSMFVLLSGSSGLGEVFFRASPDFSAIPGNDQLVTLGAFGVNSAGTLANTRSQERTLAHELGHTLGLRHGGNDHVTSSDPTSPNFKGDNYLSLMSYSHQLSTTSRVISYSDLGDPTFPDWLNLRLDFQTAAVHLGNTLNQDPGVPASDDDDNQTIAEFEDLNQAPIDLVSPTVRVDSPASGAALGLGSNLMVMVTATDNVAVNSVMVSFDLDGDGSTSSMGETVLATRIGSSTFQAIFSQVTGPLGTRMISVTANDTSLNTTRIASPLRVTNAGEALMITSGESVNAPENQTAVLTVTTNASNPSSVMFSIVGGADQTQFSIDNDGRLAFVVSRDFEFPTDTDGNGVYEVGVQASNGSSSVMQMIRVTVTNRNESPVITSSATINTPENRISVMTIAASDPDAGTTLQFSIVGGADHSRFAIGSQGLLTFVTSPNFESPLDADGDNIFEVTVQVSDSLLAARQTIRVTVTNLNETPMITSGTAFNASENQTAVGTITASDPDSGTTLIFGIVGGADRTKFSLTSGGVLTFSAPQNFEMPTDANIDGIHEVIVQVTDGVLTATQAITVTITNVNETPAITTSSPITIPENQTFVATISGQDPDAGSSLAFSLVGGADQSKFSISTGGLLTFITAPNFEAPTDDDRNGIYQVLVQVSDGLLVSTRLIDVVVGDVDETLQNLIYAASGTSVLRASVMNGRLLVKINNISDTRFDSVSPNLIGSITIRGDRGADVIDLTGLSRSTYSQLTRIVLDGGAGNDNITGSADFDEMISGGLGNDVLNGGLGGQDRLLETATIGSANALMLTLTNRNLTGGLGSDTLSGFEEALLSGGNGADTLNAAAFTGQVTLIGGGGNDVLTGGSSDDSLDGGDGNDVLTGNAGNDTLLGGVANDKLMGGIGNDQLFGGDGSDTVVAVGGSNYLLNDSSLAGDGNDALDQIESALITTGNSASTINVSEFSGSGVNTLTGGGAGDVIVGSRGTDSIVGGGGNDRLQGLAGRDTVSGGVGDDTIEGGADDDQLKGEDGNDSLLGQEGADTLDGGVANDVLSGGDGADSLLGQAGNDLLSGGIDNDVLNGGANTDQFQETGITNVVIGSATVASSFGMDSFAAMEGVQFIGTLLNDKMRVNGFSGTVNLDGLSGDDLLIGGIGRATLLGGDGNDTLQALATSTNPVTLLGGAGDDVLQGAKAADMLLGEAGNDTLQGGAGNDNLDGGANDDAIAGQDGDDFLFGRDGNDTVIGGVGKDRLSGGVGDDLLIGGFGTDTIDGELGNDTALGGQGGSGDFRRGREIADGGDSITAEVIDEAFTTLFAFE
jgi:VCBS repeat-containing protein